MSYAIKEDVKALFRDFADNSEAAVSDDDLDLFLDNTTAMIDSKIGTLYLLPITEIDNPQSFKVLKQLQMYKVACIVDDILNNYGEADKKPSWCKMAESIMQSLVPDREKCKQCKPTMILPDAQYLGTDTQRSRISISNTSGTIIRKGEDNW